MAYRLQPKRRTIQETQAPPTPKKDEGLPVVAPQRPVRKQVQKDKEKSEKIKKKIFFFIAENAVKYPIQLLDFVRWIAIPREVRSPKTQGEYAKISNVNPDTLSKYKHIVGFWDEVARYRNTFFRKWTSDVYYGLVKRARGGNAREVELFAKLFEGYAEKLKVQDEPPTETLDPKDVEQIRHALTNIGLKNIIRMNKFEENELNEPDEPEINA